VVRGGEAVSHGEDANRVERGGRVGKKAVGELAQAIEIKSQVLDILSELGRMSIAGEKKVSVGKWLVYKGFTNRIASSLRSRFRYLLTQSINNDKTSYG
jgi:hypothetical protein